MYRIVQYVLSRVQIFQLLFVVNVIILCVYSVFRKLKHVVTVKHLFEKKYNNDVMYAVFTDDEIAEMNKDFALVVH